MAILGTKITTASNGQLTISASIFGATQPNQRAIILEQFVAPEAGYVTRLGVLARRGFTGSRIYLGIWAVNDAGQPAQLLGRTAQLVVGTSFADVSGPIAWSDPDLAGALTAVRLEAGQRFALGLVVNNIAADIAAIPGTTTHYRRNLVASALPTDPFGATATGTDARLSLYAEFTANSKPAAALTSPSAGAALNTSTPTLSGVFTDADTAAPRGDRLRAYQLEVRRTSDNALMWGGGAAYFVAGTAERAASGFSRVYAGLALASGPTYSWRAQVFDDSLEASDWTAPRLFTVNPAGQVDTATDGTPDGKIDSLSSAIDWTARWHHPTALAMDRAQVRVLRQGALIKLGAEVTVAASSSAVPGTVFTIQDTVAGIGALQPGAYTYQVRGRASDGQWSPWSEPGRGFRVNAPPTTPSNLQPPDGSASSSRPLLEWNISDPDIDDVMGVDTISEVEITRPNATVTTVQTSNYDATRGVGFFQTTSSEVSATGTYKWRVRGRDTSAIAASGEYGLGAWSAMRSFQFTAGPVVTITNPSEGEVETTSVPTLTWATSGQVSFQVQAFNADAPTPFKQSSVIASSAASFQIPAGWLRNGGDYDLVVIVTNGSGQTARSLRRRFTVQYPAPIALQNLQASAIANVRSVEPDAILLSWSPSTYPPGEFAGYVIRRRLATEEPDAAVTIRTVTIAGQTRFIDHWAPPNTTLIYGISQLRRIGADVIDSDVIEIETDLPLTTGVLNSAYDGALRLTLMHLDTDLGGDFSRPEAAHFTWGGEGKPTLISTPAHYGKRTVQLTITVRGDERGSLEQHLGDFEAVRMSGHPLCLRLERPEERMFCRIVGAPWKRGSQVGTRTLRFSLEEIAYVEGESPSV